MARYKAKAIAGTQQYGTAGDNNTPQIAIDLQVPQLGKSVTCFLYFSAAAYPYSVERLRVLGWTGDKLSDLKGIDKNEVEIEITEREYQGKTQMRVEILTGPGKVTLEKPITPGEFEKRVALLTGKKVADAKDDIPF